MGPGTGTVGIRSIRGPRRPVEATELLSSFFVHDSQALFGHETCERDGTFGQWLHPQGWVWQDGVGALEHTILLVEDNASDVELAQRALLKQDIRARLLIARDGQEALDMLFGLPAGVGRLDPALILLDLHLPRRDGFEVLKEVKSCEHGRCWPVVVLTTSAEDTDVSRAYLLGANSYIRKPVDFSEFSRTIGQVASYWLAVNRRPRRGP